MSGVVGVLSRQASLVLPDVVLTHLLLPARPAVVPPGHYVAAGTAVLSECATGTYREVRAAERACTDAGVCTAGH